MKPSLAPVAFSGQCAVCSQEVPATPAGEPYEGRARLVVHDHPRPEFGVCIGSRMVVLPVGQLVLFTVAEVRMEAA